MMEIACRLSALDREQHQRWRVVTERLHSAVQETRELPDGYALRLPADDDTILMAAEFITLERRCCPFLRFEIVVDSEGPAWIRLRGGPGVKELLRTELKSLRAG